MFVINVRVGVVPVVVIIVVCDGISFNKIWEQMCDLET